MAISPHFDSPQQVADRLRRTGYVPSPRITGVVHLAERLGKPVLVEGPAGTGKTQLAKSVADSCGLRLIRLQCYEGLDEAKALYEWDYRKQLLHIAQAGANGSEHELFDERFLLTRPLLEAIRSEEPVVLLVDEVDRLDIETEALLLEVLSDYQVSIPELGTLRARSTPLVFLTSNNSRELSEALKRRCLYLHLGYPTVERERDIVLARVPGIDTVLADKVGQLVRSLRSLELRKKPSVAETLDWARTLVLLGADDVTGELLADTLPVLLKNESDIDLALKEFGE
ncbi:MoxR family ATPase [Streptomyces sp. NPDC004237]|uniref:AAA family ATPase n=1 Tax=Streptomyces sp. NPDC004237 TaxID=3154455 RepID=UPI0033B1AC20